MISRIQFVFGLEIRIKEGSIRNPFLFEDFKLGRYILANLENGVDEACWINFYCLNAMFWMCWHVDDCLNTLCLHLSLIWNFPNVATRLWCSSGLVNACFWVSECSSGLVNAYFWVSECYLVLVEGLKRYFESYIAWICRLLLANEIWCIFMMICCCFLVFWFKYAWFW